MKMQWKRITAVFLAALLMLTVVGNAASIYAESASPFNRIMDILKQNTGEPETGEDYLELANIAIGQKEYSAALDYLQKGKEILGKEDNVTLSTMWLKSASIYAIQGDTATALEHLNQAIELNQESASAYLLRAQIYLADQKNDQAAMDLKAYTALAPTDFNTRLTLAQLYESMKRYSEAQGEYKAIYQDQPDNDAMILNANRCLFLDGQYNEALAAFEEYLTSHASAEKEYRSVASFLKAACLMQLTRYPEAIKGFEEALEEGYAQADCYEQLMACAFESGASEKVIQYGKKAEKLTMPSWALFYQRMGISYMQLKKNDDAIKNLTKSLSYDEKLSGTYYYRGLVWMAQEKYQKAVDDLTQSIEQKAVLEYSYYNRAVCYVQLLNYEAAVDDLGQVMTTGSNEELKTSAKDILWQLAQYYEQQETNASEKTDQPTEKKPKDEKDK